MSHARSKHFHNERIERHRGLARANLDNRCPGNLDPGAYAVPPLEQQPQLFGDDLVVTLVVQCLLRLTVGLQDLGHINRPWRCDDSVVPKACVVLPLVEPFLWHHVVFVACADLMLRQALRCCSLSSDVRCRGTARAAIYALLSPACRSAAERLRHDAFHGLGPRSKRGVLAVLRVVRARRARRIVAQVDRSVRHAAAVGRGGNGHSHRSRSRSLGRWSTTYLPPASLRTPSLGSRRSRRRRRAAGEARCALNMRPAIARATALSPGAPSCGLGRR